MSMPAAPAPDPIVAIATAPGRGAIGIVRVSGAGLMPLAQALCQRQLAPRVASYGPIGHAGGSALDHGLALFFPAPHSYTGEDVLELQVHGGPVVLQLLLQRCLDAARQEQPGGMPLLPRLRLARPGEFTERAFLNDKMDLAQAEAVMDLIDASTETAARSAARSLAGAFSSEIRGLLGGLVELRMLIEATLDFPEEELDVLHAHDVSGRLQQLLAAVAGVRGRARQGSLLREGIRVVIAGQPNAGKSSLLNALAGSELAIVTDIAGTTRDVVQQAIQIDGVPLHVLDTAGLRPTVDAVERMGVARAWEQLQNADAVLWVRDLTRRNAADYAAADADIATAMAQKVPAAIPVLQVWNKADAAPALEAGADADAIHLSARTGAGLEQLRQRLLQLAGWQGSAGEGLFTARERHLQALDEAAGHLEQAAARVQQPEPMLDLVAEELRLAQNALGEITGEFSADDLLGVIFSRFCIGK